MSFHNPYHFVPVIFEEKSRFKSDLNKEDFENGKVTQVTHDRFTPTAYSGRLISRLTAETPFVVGGRQERESDDEPAKVHQFMLDGQPAIPGSTLRGMLSSIVEASTNSAMRVLIDKVYSFRKRAAPGEALSKVGMNLKTKSSELF